MIGDQGADGTAPVEVTVVILAYGAEPLLEECVASAVHEASREVLVVDNGCTSNAVRRVAALPGVRVIRPGRNLGFAGGCNLAASEAAGRVIVLLNSDAVARPGAVEALARALDDPTVGVASASLRLLDRPELLNSSGNPVHYLGVTWAGDLGRPADEAVPAAEVASASGAAAAVRTDDWRRWGGFWDELFAYCEDTELSLRAWIDGLRVVFVADAVVLHHYEFNRNPRKLYLLERNRLLMVLTVYERRTLTLLSVPLAGFELAVLALALRQGWARQKLAGWWWLLTHVGVVRRRRQVVQGARRLPDAVLVPVLTATFDPSAESGVSAPAWASVVSRTLWRVLSRAIAAGGPPEAAVDRRSQAIGA